MNATMLDFRTRMSEIQAVIVAWQDAKAQMPSARDCAAAGMWADRDDMGDPAEWVRTRRAKRRFQ